MTGKWSQSGVPHKGWSCVYVEDLEEPSTICEMCEQQEIRYAHHMQHSQYPDTLIVGCVCAENMESDPAAPKQREQRLKNASTRRKRWLSRRWRVSAKGNPYLNTNGYNIVVYPAGSAWSFRIKHAVTGSWWLPPARRTYSTEDAAKLAAFDGLIYLKHQ